MDHCTLLTWSPWVFWVIDALFFVPVEMVKLLLFWTRRTMWRSLTGSLSEWSVPASRGVKRYENIDVCNFHYLMSTSQSSVSITTKVGPDLEKGDRCFFDSNHSELCVESWGRGLEALSYLGLGCWRILFWHLERKQSLTCQAFATFAFESL